MHHFKTTLTAVMCLTLLSALALAGYKALPVEIQPASEYPSHQAFQNMVIGARAFTTDADIRSLFDSKKMYQRGIMPMLVVIENKNDFAVRLHGREIYLIGPDESRLSPLDPGEVMLQISLKKPLDSYSTRKEILLQRSVKPVIREDFERKAMGEKVIAPGDADWGVVFFPLPENDSLQGFRVFMPEVENLTTGDALVFFEFDINR